MSDYSVQQCIHFLCFLRESSEEHASKNHRQTFTGSTIRRNGQHPGNQSRQSYSGRNDVTQSGGHGNKMKIEPVSQVQVSGMQMTNRNQVCCQFMVTHCGINLQKLENQVEDNPKLSALMLLLE